MSISRLLRQTTPTVTLAGMSAEVLDEYVRLRDEKGAWEAKVHDAVCQPHILRPHLTAGRLVRVRAGATDWGWGVLLTVSFKPPNVPLVRCSL